METCYRKYLEKAKSVSIIACGAVGLVGTRNFGGVFIVCDTG